MSNKKYDDLIRALVPRQPGPQQPGHQPAGHQPMAGYPVYPQAGPYYQGQAPIVYQQGPPPAPAPMPYQRYDYHQPVGDPWPVPEQPRRQESRKGWNGVDVAAVIFAVACLLIFIAAALPR